MFFQTIKVNETQNCQARKENKGLRHKKLRALLTNTIQNKDYVAYKVSTTPQNVILCDKNCDIPY